MRESWGLEHAVERGDSVLKSGGVSSYDESKSDGLQAGTLFTPRILERINSCSAALLLVSVRFVSSPYIRTHELPALEERRNKEDLHVVPLILSPVDLDEIPFFKDLKRIPVGQSLADLRGAAKTEQLLEVRRHLKKAVGTFSVGRPAREVAPTAPVAKDVAPAPDPQEWYLRRRCRLIPSPSRKLRAFMKALLTDKHRAGMQRLTLKIHGMRGNSFEQLLAEAMQLEALGRIQQMETSLADCRFKGEQEAVRLLYHGIALEKLGNRDGNLQRAMECYREILTGFHDCEPTLRVAAQFNLGVCHEKLQEFAKTHFSDFVADRRTMFPTREMLWHKALVMEMIVCMEARRRFPHDRLVERALKQQVKVDPSGYAKTLIMYNRMKKRVATEREIEQLMNVATQMPINASAATYCEIAKDLMRARDKRYRQVAKRLLAICRNVDDHTIKRYEDRLKVLANAFAVELP